MRFSKYTHVTKVADFHDGRNRNELLRTKIFHGRASYAGNHCTVCIQMCKCAQDLRLSHLVFHFLISLILQCDFNPRSTMFLKKNYSISTNVFNEFRVYCNSQNSSFLCHIMSQTGLVHILTPYIF